MKIRFQADADLNEDILTGTRRREPLIDFQTSDEAGIRGLSDDTVLAAAAREGRVLVSHDRKTMPRHFAGLIATNESLGLLIVSQKAGLIVTIEELLLIWNASEAEEWINRISSIPL